ncbi:MAG: trehalose-phosphatase [Planctomycetota bacterium]|nr:trehalose-phosphatase [Planctomycetota bacterium]
MEDDLDQALEAIARVPILLVATDYDGTLSPIVDNPDDAKPVRESIIALRALATLSGTHCAVISGRSLSDLANLSSLDGQIMLVGSHGSEFDQDFVRTLTDEQVLLRQRILDEMHRIAAEDKRFHIETKPASIAFHYRNVADEKAEKAVSDLLAGAATWDDVRVKSGKKVIELAVVHTSKGDCIDALRHRVGATAVVYFGDDITDEDAFVRLHGPDVSVKVGTGDSAATFRIHDPTEVARRLARLASAREAFLAGADAIPIERHALLSDGRVMALVSPGAKISWMCAPRVDGPALFSELLGGPAAGHFTIEPAKPDNDPQQQYDGTSLVLKTTWPRLTVTDFLDCSAGKPTQRAGRTDLIRQIEGRGEVCITFAPRLDFGRLPTRLVIRDGGLEIDDTIDPIVLRAPGVEWELLDEGSHQTAVGKVTLRGEPLRLELRYGTGSLREQQTLPPQERYRRTKSYWESWADRLSLPKREGPLVRRSALVLKGLCYGPTGGIVAAATTSLPEHLGGIRNWDYRYCWLRDAAMSASALVKLGSFSEAMAFLDWMLAVVDRAAAPERLMPLYTVTGHEVGAEAEITELAGYAGSRPVRVGNAARGQVQLDVFGPIAELVWQLLLAEAPVSSEHWRLVEAMVGAVEARWHEPDHGIWEIRKPRRHHVHSKVMCWLAVDRGIQISERFLDRKKPAWEKLRQTIAEDILEKAWHKNSNAYTAAYGADDLDAASLMIGLMGLVDCTDSRFMSTIDAIDKRLRMGPTVFRYLADDGLPGREGGFFICASWLVDSFYKAGRRDEAESLFESMIELAGPEGLLPEQYDPLLQRTLGNHPQAYSHIGLIENALTLSSN